MTYRAGDLTQYKPYSKGHTPQGRCYLRNCDAVHWKGRDGEVDLVHVADYDGTYEIGGAESIKMLIADLQKALKNIKK